MLAMKWRKTILESPREAGNRSVLPLGAGALKQVLLELKVVKATRGRTPTDGR